MNKDRWNQVKDLFQRVLEQPAEAREEFIQEVSGDDTTLRFELESLLLSHASAGTFLSRPPDAEAAEVLALEDAPLVGERLGAYRVLRRVGRGGTGSVYLAVRDDAEFQQRVAIKVIRRGMANAEMLHRFRSERQILASIDHPNIARLLDGGSTPDGLPYFVMEYIEGEPINLYCNQNRLDVPARLRLFRQVCDAVRVAHQNLVVHRDLKPGNILVTPDGVPKLLDFGIAKLLNPELSADVHEPTVLELRVMTPEYASPEQMQGKTVTTASDVYSLGVMLYELLTGHRPYNLSSLPLPEMELVVCTSEPARPSEVVGLHAEEPRRDGGVRELTPESVSRLRNTTHERLRKALLGDLDNIVLKALRKEPTRRYSSVEKLADDIDNHLSGRPVDARPDTLGYILGKFVRRHRVPSAVAATALLFALALGVTITVQSSRVSAERDRAERAAAEATAVSEFLQEILTAADPVDGVGRDVSVLESVEQAVPRIDGAFAGQPEIEGAVRQAIGRTFARLGRFDEAEEQLRRALVIRRQLYGTNHEEIAETVNALGEVRYDRGDFDGAERLYDEALAMRVRVFGDEHPAVAATLDNLGNIYQQRGDTAEAERAYRDALAMRRTTLGAEHKDVASSLNNVATVLHDRKNYSGAEELYRESLALSRRLLGENHPEVSTSVNNLAVLLHDQDRHAEAEPLYREALDIARRTLGDTHPAVVLSSENLAVLLRDMERHDEALELLAESLLSAREIWSEDSIQAARVHRHMGSVELRRGDPDTAHVHFDQALKVFERKLPADDPQSVIARAGNGRALALLGEHVRAERLLVDAYNTFLEDYGPEDRDVIEYAGWLADLYDASGSKEAAAHYRAVAAGDQTAEPARVGLGQD